MSLPIINLVVVIIELFSTNIFKQMNFLRNPVRGGSPPRERIARAIRGVVHVVFFLLFFIFDILLVFLIFSERNIDVFIVM